MEQTGPAGRKGPQGDQGAQGDQGNQGSEGNPGARGPSGDITITHLWPLIALCFIASLIPSMAVALLVDDGTARKLEKVVKDRRVANLNGCELGNLDRETDYEAWRDASLAHSTLYAKGKDALHLDAAKRYAVRAADYASRIRVCELAYPEAGEGRSVQDLDRVRALPPLPVDTPVPPMPTLLKLHE